MDNKEDSVKRPLILFSGGIDSTYLIQTYLEKGISVDTLFVAANQDPDKYIKECEARVQLFKKFTEIYWDRAPTDFIQQAPADVVNDFDHNLDEHFIKVKDYAMVQPASWLMAGLIKFDHTQHSELAIGYLLGDQMPAFREEMLTAWSYLWVLIHGRIKAIPPLRFPLLDRGFTKYDVMKSIDKRLAALTWVCETPKTRDDAESDNLPVTETIYACGKCRPCRLMKHTIADIDEDTHAGPGQGWLDRVREANTGNTSYPGFKKLSKEEVMQEVHRIENGNPFRPHSKTTDSIN